MTNIPIDYNTHSAEESDRRFHADSKDTYNPGGGRESFHGIMFQLRLIILFLIKGIDKYDSFSLASEQKEADKFDDLIFRYTDGNNRNKFRFIQCKHRGDYSKKISLQGLLSTSTKGDFSLLAYFESFRKIMHNFHPDEIEHLILCTNIGFKNRDRREEFKLDGIFEPIKHEQGEEIFDILLQGKILKFKKSFEGRNLWIEHFKKYSKGDQKDIHDCIELFFEKLLFAVEHPGVEELKMTIIKEINDTYHVVEHEMAYIWIERKINEWMTNTSGTYLRAVDGKRYIEILQKRFGSVKFEFRDPVNNFIGREKQLNELKKVYESGVDTVIISGLGGIGKSQLAKKFIESNSHLFDSIVWINAENHQSIINSIKRLAFERLNIESTTLDGKIKDVRSIMEEIYQYFVNRKAVFVFDNVEFPNLNGFNNSFESFLPKSSPKPFVIITSRYQNWFSLKVIKLETFSEKEAMNLIEFSTGFENFDRHKLKVLVNQLECFPLALQQAIAFLSKFCKESRLFSGDERIASYIKMLEKESNQIFDQTVENFRGDDYEKTTLTTWNVTLKAIQDTIHGELSYDILKILSYFAPDRVPIEDIANCFQDVSDDLFKLALGTLHDYSIITIDKDVFIHRLVQFVTRAVVIQSEEEENILRVILQVHSKIKIDNLLSVWNYVISYETLVKEFSMIPGYILSHLDDKLRYEEGYDFWKSNSKYLERIFSPTSKTFLNLLENFAGIAKSCGKLTEAKSAYENIIQAIASSNRNEEGHTLKCMHNIATLLHCAGKYEKAIQLYRFVLNRQQNLLGLNHPDTLRTMNNTASALRAQCQYDEALKLYHDVYHWRKALLSDNHPDVLNTLHCIACTLADHGEYAHAHSLYKSILKKQKLVLGETHSDTLNTMKNIAIVFQNQGYFDKANEIFDNVLQIQKCHLPPDNPEILNTIENIENLNDDQENYVRNPEVLENRKKFEETSYAKQKVTLKRRKSGMKKYFKLCW